MQLLVLKIGFNFIMQNIFSNLFSFALTWNITWTFSHIIFFFKKKLYTVVKLKLYFQYFFPFGLNFETNLFAKTNNQQHYANKGWLTLRAAYAMPSVLVIPPSLLLTVIMFISGEAAPVALPANCRRAAFPHQTLQLGEHHGWGREKISSHATALPQSQVQTLTDSHFTTIKSCLSSEHDFVSVCDVSRALRLTLTHSLLKAKSSDLTGLCHIIL